MIVISKLRLLILLTFAVQAVNADFYSSIGLGSSKSSRGIITRIINLSPYRITIQGTAGDKNSIGHITLKNGTEITENNTPINVNDIASIAYTVPSGAWEDADLWIRVEKYFPTARGSENDKFKTIRATNIREYKGSMGERIHYGTDQNNSLSRPNRDDFKNSIPKSENITVLIDKGGHILFNPPLFKVNVGNKASEDFLLWSPNCSVEREEIDKIVKIKKGEKATFSIYPALGGGTCQLAARVITPESPDKGKKATTCIFSSTNPPLMADCNPSNTDLCPTDDATGENFCDHFGLKWVWGSNPENNQEWFKNNGNGETEIFYGLVKD